MNQARDSKAKEYFVMGFDLTPDKYLPMAFTAGWDAALEYLRGKEEHLPLTEYGLFVMRFAAIHDRGPRPTEILEWSHKQSQLQISALKERIRELESGSDVKSNPLP